MGAKVEKRPLTDNIKQFTDLGYFCAPACLILAIEFSIIYKFKQDENGSRIILGGIFTPSGGGPDY